MSGAIYTPLRIEQQALAHRLSVPVNLAGRGRSTHVLGGRPTLLAGVAGGLAPGVRPGDVVVADRVRLGDTETLCPAAPMLARALRAAGLTVHVGAIETTPRVVDGSDRLELARSGALAVDTESGYVATQVPDGQLAVVRTIVDTADNPLRRAGTLRRGIRALHTLSATAPTLEQWAEAVLARDVCLASPRSFCAGVERAIEIVERALQMNGAPVYVRRQIVHNTHVVSRLERLGAVFVEELDEVPRGSVAVLAAHGVAPSVRRQASERELQVIDATCPLVAKVHHEVQRYASRGNTIFLIGHAEHEEVVGTRGEAPDHVVVVDNPEEAALVEAPDPEHVSYVMQTTLAVSEAERSAAVLRARYPLLSGPRHEDICYATSNRQQAVAEVAAQCDLVLVVGSGNSSNSRRLVEVAQAAGATAHLVDDVGAVDLAWLARTRRVGVTAGASAPAHLVEELLQSLSALGDLTVAESPVTQEDVRFSLPREVS
ncbi:4-hydroxy-3-methylbut-2-enyl diphosphate reductase [Leekyejoonella antrihumi]|uniref:4-hydroxy-3-methylbut-2-enyl diphosphate reductase n=1 Tax=Leekyejoonella antrihumi TaxID=1660198 RepID=A0A563E661_9MICO|nr:4-hydroxy-3-methylbut-2-enyl diphosphate reductase [Leekyejoonella antrihumi]TWP37681.1 4-hydroxy-3-methylbut-2-enyl diphosphate reductase [Leekyejoonella antrihumi]